MKTNDIIQDIATSDSFSGAWAALCSGAQALELNIGSYCFGFLEVPENTCAVQENLKPSKDGTYFTNYSSEYTEFYEAANLEDFDTTIDWFCNHTEAALWTAVDRPVADGRLKGKYAELYHGTRDFGMKNGAVFPLRKSTDVTVGGIVIFVDPELKSAQADRLLLERMPAMAAIAEAFHLYRPVSDITTPKFPLSRREKECLKYLCLGYGIKQISYRLGTHERTVQKQITSAKKKLHATSITQAVVKALAYELIAP